MWWAKKKIKIRATNWTTFFKNNKIFVSKNPLPVCKWQGVRYGTVFLVRSSEPSSRVQKSNFLHWELHWNPHHKESSSARSTTEQCMSPSLSYKCTCLPRICSQDTAPLQRLFVWTCHCKRGTRKALNEQWWEQCGVSGYLCRCEMRCPHWEFCN